MVTSEQCAPVSEWQPVIDEPVLVYVVHFNAQYEKDEAERLSEWEGWCRGYWTDFNKGGWVWNGIAGIVTHVSPLVYPFPDPPAARRGRNPMNPFPVRTRR